MCLILYIIQCVMSVNEFKTKPDEKKNHNEIKNLSK